LRLWSCRHDAWPGAPSAGGLASVSAMTGRGMSRRRSSPTRWAAATWSRL
jgi:hypothetical protein